MVEERNLGQFLKDIRTQLGMTLREVEAATEQTSYKISNAYISQLEKGEIKNPSPHILYSLAEAYGIPYERLMVEACYLSPDHAAQNTTKALYAEDLSEDEYELAKEYLQMLRRMRKQKDK